MKESFGLFSEKSEPIPLVGVAVTGDIQGRGAKIKLCQRFRNDEKLPVEAVYRFPLPEGSSICGFKAQVGGRVITGQTEDREKAFEHYDKALMNGDGSYLLDQERPNIFTLSVGNLTPNLEVVIEINLVMLLDLEGENLRFVLPTTISPRYVPETMPDRDGIPEQGRIHPPYAQEVPYGSSLKLLIHQPSVLATVESPTHPIRVNLGTDPLEVSFTNETVRMDRDFILLISLKHSFLNRAYRVRFGDSTYLQLDLLLKNDLKEIRDESPKEIVFLLDCSGSMQGKSIREAKKALEICLRALQPETFFNIYRFGSSYKTLFRKSKPYSAKNLAEAIDYLQKVEADLGGTELLEPLEKIYSFNSAQKGKIILLLTDGQVGNEEELMQLAGRKEAKARLFTVGIGSGPNEYLIKGLARVSHGVWEFIAPGERIEPKVLRIFEKMTGPFLDDLEIAGLGDGLIQAPGRPVVFLNFPQTIFARLKEGTFQEKSIQIKGRVGHQEQEWEVEIDKDDSVESSIPLLWARERIRELEEDPWRAGEPGSRQLERKAQGKKEMIINLSKEFNLLSQYTSYVAIEEREEKTAGELQLRRVPVLLTTGWHGLGQGSTHFFLSMADPQVQYHSYDSYSESPSFCLKRETELEMPTFRKVSSAAVKVAENEDPLTIVLAILSTQTAEGGLRLEQKIMTLLGLEEKEIELYVRELKVDQSVDADLLLSTTILIRILEIYFEEQAHIWNGALKKSRDWLNEMLKKKRSMLQGQDLSTWADHYVKDQIQIGIAQAGINGQVTGGER
jgi:Ca-activated chloride channel family protein